MKGYITAVDQGQIGQICAGAQDLESLLDQVTSRAYTHVLAQSQANVRIEQPFGYDGRATGSAGHGGRREHGRHVTGKGTILKGVAVVDTRLAADCDMEHAAPADLIGDTRYITKQASSRDDLIPDSHTHVAVIQDVNGEWIQARLTAQRQADGIVKGNRNIGNNNK